MFNPLISIIIPLYNVEKYIEECLKSILNQKYQNFEVIIINDGSSDNSEDIVKSFESKFSGKLNLKTINNSGQAIARNIGLELSKGELIYFLDSDDYISPDLLQSAVEKFTTEDISIYMFNAKAFSDEKLNLDSFNYIRGIPKGIYSNFNVFNLSINNGCYFVQPCCYMIKADDFKNIKFLEGRIYEDNTFTTQLLTTVKRAVYVSENTFFFRRVRANSTVTKSITRKSVDDYISNVEAIASLDIDDSCKLGVRVFNNRLMMNALRKMYLYFSSSIPLNYRFKLLKFCLKNKINGIPFYYLLLSPKLFEWLKKNV